MMALAEMNFALNQKTLDRMNRLMKPRRTLRDLPVISHVRDAANSYCMNRLQPHRYNSSLEDATIRLLYIHEKPKRGFEEIETRVFKLADAPPYHALSYTWGPPRKGVKLYDESERRPIILDGQRFPVLPNLMDAITELRRSKKFHHYFWIDAISINQEDLGERERQVSIMDKIYKKAEMVDIWLGKCEEDIDAPRSFLMILMMSALSDMVKNSLPDIRLVSGAQDPNNTAILACYGLPPLKEENWAGVIRLLERAWFYRTWIVQEVALAREVKVL